MKTLTDEKLTIVGAAGMIGSNMAQTAIMMGLTSNICLYDPYAPGLEGVAEELFHCGFEGVNITFTSDIKEALTGAKYIVIVMDKLLRKIGLSGRSFVPMIIGFGCSVPAIMATRTLSSERDRKMTILLTPFMSCSAKLPIYALFTYAFFPKYRALVMVGLYFTGIIVGVLFSLLLKNTAFQGEPVPFVMELPNYRLPSLKSVGMLIWDKAKDFITKAFTIIFMASIVIWFLQTFDVRLNVVVDSKDSLLALIGGFAAPVFVPLGFGDWRISTALITGFTAKESVV